MCLILFNFKAHPRYRLILAANRDEFYARPTETAGFWADAPLILAGRDAVHGGTWLGITKTGRFAAVTNYRDPQWAAGIKSRGDLTANFLKSGESPENYLREIERSKNDYSGFNLLVGDFSKGANELFYYSNRGAKIEKVSAGIHGLSNALLDTNWHKVENGKARLTEILGDSAKIRAGQLFEMLADRRAASDEELPETGVGIERERVLSSAYIAVENYGTRLSSVLLIDETGEVVFTEKTYVGAVGEVNYKFSIE